MGRFMMDRDQNLKFVSFLMNAILVLGAFFLALDLVAPLFGSELSVYAIVVHGSWIATSLLVKLSLNRIRKGLPIRTYDYLLGCLVGTVDMVGSFPNLIGIILSILLIVGTVFLYRSQRKKEECQKTKPEGLSDPNIQKDKETNLQFDAINECDFCKLFQIVHYLKLPW
jgi:membrane protease YdiL (CAAX protease family)